MRLWTLTLHQDSITQVKTTWECELLAFIFVAPTFRLESPCIRQPKSKYEEINFKFYKERVGCRMSYHLLRKTYLNQNLCYIIITGYIFLSQIFNVKSSFAVILNLKQVHLYPITHWSWFIDIWIHWNKGCTIMITSRFRWVGSSKSPSCPLWTCFSTICYSKNCFNKNKMEN